MTLGDQSGRNVSSIAFTPRSRAYRYVAAEMYTGWRSKHDLRDLASSGTQGLGVLTVAGSLTYIVLGEAVSTDHVSVPYESHLKEGSAQYVQPSLHEIVVRDLFVDLLGEKSKRKEIIVMALCAR